jgi:hypothetical protein
VTAPFLGSFASVDDLLKEFGAPPLAPGMEVLFAVYETGTYEGDAFVLLRDETGQLWSTGGSHCSCHGLEGQWDLAHDSRENLVRLAQDGYGATKTAAAMAVAALWPEAVPS